MDFNQQWPKQQQQERACLITLLIEQQLQVKLGLATQLQYHRQDGGVAVSNPANGHRLFYGFHALEAAEMNQLVCTDQTLQVRDAFFQPSPVLTIVGPPGTGKTETLKDICKHTIGRPVRVVRPAELDSEADLTPIFALMDTGVFVILDEVDKSPAAAEVLPMLIAHAQSVCANSSPSASVSPALGITYESRPETERIDAMTTSDAMFGQIEMSHPPLDNILRYLHRKHSCCWFKSAFIEYRFAKTSLV